mgnify:CR=1 FL=1
MIGIPNGGEHLEPRAGSLVCRDHPVLPSDRARRPPWHRPNDWDRVEMKTIFPLRGVSRSALPRLQKYVNKNQNYDIQ